MTTKTTMVVSALSVALLLGAVPLLAHHAFSAEFDNQRPLDMAGVFVKMDWVNPHGKFVLRRSMMWGMNFESFSSSRRRGGY